MNFFNLFKRGGSAPVARDRLQILLAHERPAETSSDLLVVLRDEILAAVTRHVEVDPNGINVNMKRGRRISTLEVGIEIQNRAGTQAGRSRRKRPVVAAHRPA